MKKVLLLVVAALTVVSVGAQEKKKSGLMNALKKGVESSTGLKVSDETLIVYPKIGEWKISVVSCIGNPELGAVALTLKVAKISGGNAMAERCLLSEAKTTDGVECGFGRNSADPLYDFKLNTPVEVTLQQIGGVPDGAKALDVKFYIGSFADEGRNVFEARRVPILWQEAGE